MSLTEYTFEEIENANPPIEPPYIVTGWSNHNQTPANFFDTSLPDAQLEIYGAQHCTPPNLLLIHNQYLGPGSLVGLDARLRLDGHERGVLKGHYGTHIRYLINDKFVKPYELTHDEIEQVADKWIAEHGASRAGFELLHSQVQAFQSVLAKGGTALTDTKRNEILAYLREANHIFAWESVIKLVSHQIKTAETRPELPSEALDIFQNKAKPSDSLLGGSGKIAAILSKTNAYEMIEEHNIVWSGTGETIPNYDTRLRSLTIGIGNEVRRLKQSVSGNLIDRTVVGSEVTAVLVNPIANSSQASVVVENGVGTVNAVQINEGNNLINIEVTASPGVSEIHTVNVVREAST